MLESAENPAPGTRMQTGATAAREGRKIRNRRHAPPSGRADTDVTRTHLPLAALKWVAVVLGVLAMLVVAPLVDLVTSGFAGIRRLLDVAALHRR